MNEVPYAFPIALVEKINEHSDVQTTVVSFYDNINEKLQESSVEIIPLKSRNHLDFSSYLSLRRVIADKGIDIIHTHPNATGSVARLVAATTDVDIVDTRHNDHRHFNWYQRLPTILPSLFTDRYVSNSKNTQQSFTSIENTLLSLGGGSHEVVYNGVDPMNIDELPPEPDRLPDGPRIVNVARYVPQKNHEILVRSMEYIQDEHPEASLILIGKGPKYEKISQLIDRLNLEDTVIQTGYLPQRSQVFSVVANSDVFVVPSWYEGFCIAAVEAMLTGTPIVASDISVLREVVGDVGLFADPSVPSMFADRITTLLDDDERRKSLGRESAERARTEFSLDKAAEGYVKVYRDILDE